MFKPETALFDRTRNEPTAAGIALAKAWNRSLDDLTDGEIMRAADLAERKHRYKSLPQPGDLRAWLDESNPSGQRHAGARTGLWEVDHTDDKGYVFYRRKVM